MKRVLLLLLLALGASSFGASFLSARDAQRQKMVEAAESVGVPFTISGSLEFADPRVVYPALVAAAERARVNVLRTGAGYTARDKLEITQYVLLTSPTRLYRAFSLQSGKWLSPRETISSDKYLSTQGRAKGAQVGVLSDFGGSDLVAIRPLRKAFASLPVAGAYFLEVGPRSAGRHPYNLFLSALAQGVTHNLEAEAHKTLGGQPRLSQPITARSFAPSGTELYSVPVSTAGNVLRLVEYLVAAATVLLLVYRTLYQAKRVAVLRLLGFSVARVWYLLTARLAGGAMVLLALLSLAAAGSVPGTTVGFVVRVEVALGRVALVVLAFSFLTAGYVWRARLNESLKNRKATGGIFALNTAVKAVCWVAVVVVGAGLWLQWTEATSERAQLGDWAATRSYGIFYPVSVGDDLLALETGRPGAKVAETYELYPLLDREGALYIDATDYNQGEPPPRRGVYFSVTVNPNYLRAYPLRDAEGHAVTVGESTTAWVLLVPKGLWPERARILAYFRQQRQVTVDETETWLGRAVPPAVAHQRVRIIWMPAHYEVFSFDPYVNPRGGDMITSPIVQVMTLSNSAGLDRANAITGGADAALKVRLAPGGPEATLRDLEPALAKMKLSSNLAHLVTMDDWVFEEVHELRQEMVDIAIGAAVLGVVMFAFVAQGLAIAFERFARKVAVRRLFGFGLWRAHREAFLAMAGTSVLEGLAALAVNAAGLGTGSGQARTGGGNVASLSVMLAVMAVVGGSELVFAAVWLAHLERRRLAAVLKEEF
ncbi:MAG: hypothetical protein ACP5VR_11370 [Acidimicrobiales bacterium]